MLGILALGLGHRPSSRAEKLKQKKTSAGQPLPAGAQKRRHVYRLLGPLSPGEADSCTNWSMTVSEDSAQGRPEVFRHASWASWCKEFYDKYQPQAHICSRLFIARNWVNQAERSEFWDLQDKCLQQWWVRDFSFSLKWYALMFSWWHLLLHFRTVLSSIWHYGSWTKTLASS